MAFDKEQVNVVEKARRLSFADFDKIELSQGGVRIIANLFLNPDCLIDVNLEAYIDKEKVYLADLSKHIMTAAPATLAVYAKDNKKLYLTRDDVIRCFALDHLDTIADNEIIKLNGAAYALAHALSLVTISNIENRDDVRVVELQQENIIYKNVIVPDNLEVKIGDEVWHHFGVLIDMKSDEDEKIFSEQKVHNYWLEIIKKVQVDTIDFTDEQTFNKNVYKKILNEVNNRKSGHYEQVAKQSELDRAANNNSKVNKIMFTN